jgi:hypothetical protein
LIEKPDNKREIISLVVGREDHAILGHGNGIGDRERGENRRWK